MKYLLDTSVFLWALAAPSKLNRRARQVLSNQREGLFLSAASAWEISVKFGLGKLRAPGNPCEMRPDVDAELGDSRASRFRTFTHWLLATCRFIIRTRLTEC